MGSRIDKWPKDRAEGLVPFFSQIGYKPTREWKEENVFWDPYGTHPPSTGTGAAAPEGSENKKPTTLPAKLKPLAAVLPDGTKVKLQPTRDPREVFADWLITPTNPWFTRAIANRVWAWLLGRGIIHEPDDIRPDNPPANPELLAYLEKEMIAGKYDMRRLYRLILTSATYQLAPAQGLADAKAEANFAAYPLQRLDAEVLIDAVNQITGTTDLYTSPIPEPFTYIPKDMPAVAIADGSITSPFLALFGRSARATGMWNERDNRHMPAQWLHMLNSSHIQRKLEGSPTLKALFESKKPAREIIEELYLTVLSRFPTPGEMARAEAYSTVKGAKPGAPKRREDWIDITWALINSIEFLYRH